MACFDPSERVITPSFPVTPGPAVAGPVTGGQNPAHEPLQLDLVAVSGTNQYSVKPLALVSTVTPPMFAVFRAVPDEPAAGDANAISSARDSLNGHPGLDQGITMDGEANIVPDDGNGIAFGRTPGQILNIVYLTPGQATSGGFYPNGLNGELTTSG